MMTKVNIGKHFAIARRLKRVIRFVYRYILLKPERSRSASALACMGAHNRHIVEVEQKWNTSTSI